MIHDGEAMAEGAAAWARVESPTGDRAGVDRMMDLVEAEVAGLDVGVERVPGRDGLGDALVLRAGPRTDAGAVLVLSHLDTVHPVGTLAGELPVRREGDRLYGPGIYDMKAGAYLGLQAFRHVVASGSAPRPLAYLFTPDEEIGSPTSRDLIEAEARRASIALVTEPARDGGKIVTARKGVGRFEVTITGRPAHAGSRHADGRSAIREAARQILAVEGLTDYARGVTTTVGRVEGGTADNVIPRRAWFAVDLRVTNPADGEAFGVAILGLAPHDPDCRVEVLGGMNRPPMPEGEGTRALFARASGLAREIGFDLVHAGMVGGGSDGNFTAALGVPTLDGLGADGDGAHTLAEYALVSSFSPRARLLSGLMAGA